jgi:tRNA threonylcarbamoyladenosine biosynthesis protein TsaE
MEFVVESIDALDLIVPKLIKLKQRSNVFAFYGQMGAGKTTIIKAICRQLSVTDEVNSPTFSIVNEYNTTKGEPVFHFDFFRINAVEEAFDIGYENYFYSPSYCFIEWPEKIGQLLPQNCVKVFIDIDSTTDARIIRCE